MDKENKKQSNRKKYIKACLSTVEDKEELQDLWQIAGLDIDLPENWEFKCDALKETMGGQYFDLPADQSQQYSILEFMFFSGDWKYARKIDTLKELANEL